MSTYEALKYTFTGANITGIPTSAVSSGTFADARISSGSVTQHVSAVTNTTGTWSPSMSAGSINVLDARYQRVGDLCYAIMWARATSQITANNTIMTMSGLPITARNTGDSADCVGWGQFQGKSSNGYVILPIVMSNSSTMSFVAVNNSLYAPNSTVTGTSGSQLTNANFKLTQNNFYTLMESADANHMCLQITYLV